MGHRKDKLQGTLDLLVLRTLAAGGAMHGTSIADRIAETSDEVLRVEEGSLYPALHRMEEAGWIRAKWVTRDSGRRARIYELSAAGNARLDDEEARWQAVNRVLRTV